MTRRTVLPFLIAAALALIGCGSAGADEGEPMTDSRTFTGAVTYRERMALPHDAVLTVTLEDVSMADAPATTLAQTTTALNGRQVPIPFSLLYPTAAVKPGAIYAARARVTEGDQVLFITTERIQVDPLDPASVEMVMTRVVADAPPVPDVSLADTYWKLVEVAGQPVVVADGAREPHVVLGGDGRFHGSGGVNNLMGGYTRIGDALTFSQVASTLMAGTPEAMAQEQQILGALGTVRGFRIVGDSLTLVDDAGHPVIRAVAVALR